MGTNIKLLFFLLLLSANSWAQNTEFELKALLVINIAEETKWKDQSTIGNFQIGVYGSYSLYNQLKAYSKNYTIHDKKFNVIYHDKFEQDLADNIILVNENIASNVELNQVCSGNKLLLVDGLVNYNYACVNFFVNSDNELEFKVNANCFEHQDLMPSASLLVYATNKEDAIRMINKSEEELKRLKEDYQSQLEKYNQLKENLDNLQHEIKKDELKIKILKDKISDSQVRIEDKDKAYSQLQSRLEALNNEYLLTQSELIGAIDKLQKSATELKELESDLVSKRSEIDSNQNILNKQKQKIIEQDELLVESGEVVKKTTRAIVWVLLIVLVLILLLIIIYRENKAKRNSLRIIKKKNQEILEASRHKDEFISNLSHEVRTPLNAIIGYTNLVQDRITNEEDKKYLGYVTSSSKNLLRVINDILDLKKIESGKIEIEAVDFQLKEAVTDVFLSTELLVAQKNIDYKLNYDDQLPMMLNGDPVKVNQVLLNLLSNAAKFTDKGKIELNVRLLDKTNDKVDVEFEVKDTGIGISSEKIDLIFESFEQEDDEVRKKYGGTGLGLAIAKKFVQLMGGDIVVKSEQNVGTSFIFNIPFEVSKGVEENRSVGQSINKSVLDGLRIVFADDLPINRDLFERQINNLSANIDVYMVTNGEELVDAVNQNKFDVIVTDIQMPGMDGVEATKLIRKSDLNIKIIGLSAGVLKKDILRYKEAGMNDYVVKPYIIDDVIIKIAEVLGLDWHNTKIKKNKKESSKSRFARIRSMSSDEEEYQATLKELIEDIRSDLDALGNDKTNRKLIHSLLNKILYLEDQNLENLCRKYELHCDAEQSEVIQDYDVLHKAINDFLNEI